MDLLKRSLAPITEAGWEEIDDFAKAILKTYLTARKFVDVEGPHGSEYGVISLGRLEIPKKQPEKGVEFGVNKVQPLVEARAPFELNIWELDNVERGSQDAELNPMIKAAQSIALFEERSIYYGLKDGGIKGLLKSSDLDPISFNGDVEKFLDVVSHGVTELMENAVEGPYALVVGPKLWRHLGSYMKGYPLKPQLERLLNGSVILNPLIEETFIVSLRGGDFKLILGQDLSIGYQSHDTKSVRLYFTESFTFRNLEPAAILKIEWKQQ